MSIASAALRHVVVFKYKSHTSDDQIRQVTDAFRALQHKIPGIRAFEHGVNNSPEGKNLGFTHVYTLTFDSAAARDAYLPHPEHAQFGVPLGQLNLLADVFVVDYVPEE
ncbi:MAG: Dabb family protein [Chloroflexota bacterium]|nr:Dabb family protein [Chloroflexota bacterium]